MAKEQSNQTPEEQEAAALAKSKAPRQAGDAVADVPAATSDATEGKPREADSDKTGRMTKALWLENSGAIFGVPPWTIAGALYDVEDDAELSQAQVQSRLDKLTPSTGQES